MPGGRPSPIDKTIGHRDVDGTPVPVTVFDRIVSALRAGNYIEGAAASAGMSKQAVYDWMKLGARTRLANTPDKDRTTHERRCVEFLDAVAEAEAAWEAQANTTLEQLSRGGIPVETVTVKVDGKGKVIERTTKTTATLPDAATIKWRLKRRFRDRYAERIEVTGAEGEPLLPMDERAAAIVEGLRNAREAKAEAEKPKPTPAKPVKIKAQVKGGASAKSARAGKDPQA